MEWQPIETAPKDGGCILLAFGEVVTLGGWLTDMDYGADHEGQLGCSGWWNCASEFVEPTHWMQLPESPATLAAREEK